MVEKIIELEDIMPKFDSAGNMITTKPKKIEQLEGIINGKKVFNCQYCDKEWPSDISRIRHESWCSKNPDCRTYYKKPEKAKVEPKTKISKEKDVIKELREFDKTFGLTDEQIVKYIRSFLDK